MFNNRWAGGAAALAIAASLTPAAYAQFTSADINGQLLDTAGNPVSGATVTITDERTGRSTRATTSRRGVFFESGLAVGGPYTITAETGESVAAVVDGMRRAEGVSSVEAVRRTEFVEECEHRYRVGGQNRRSEQQRDQQRESERVLADHS